MSLSRGSIKLTRHWTFRLHKRQGSSQLDVSELPEERLCFMKLLFLLLLETGSLSPWGDRVVVVTALGQQGAPSILNMGLFVLGCLKPVCVVSTGCQGHHLSGFLYIKAITRDV
jgi:hypothetical protein